MSLPRHILHLLTLCVLILGIFLRTSSACVDKDDRALIEKTQYRLGGDPGAKALGCYFQDYAVYRPGGSELKPDKIDPFLCSFIVYFIVNLVQNEIRPFDPWADIDLGGFKKIVALKQQNPNLRVTVATGGWNMGSVVFSNLAARPELRKKFIDSLVSFLDKWNFDGFDLDWEYPTQRGGSKEDKRNFIVLLKEIREAFDRRTQETGKIYMLTAAVSASVWTVDEAYNIPEMFKYLDFAQIMAYDFHGTWDVSPHSTAHHAPLFAPPMVRDPDPNYNEKYTADWAIQHYIEMGAPKEKLLLGVPLYGRGWKLADPNKFTLGSPVNGPNPAGPFLKEAGFLGVTEICLKMKNNGWQKGTEHNLTYVYGEGQWLGYDDEIAVQMKAKYVWDNDIGGAFVWALDYEDNNQLCGIGRNPIISVLSTALQYPPNGNLVPAQVPVSLVPPSAPAGSSAEVSQIGLAPVAAPTSWAPRTTRAPTTKFAPITQPLRPHVQAPQGGPIRPGAVHPPWIVAAGLSPGLKPGASLTNAVAAGASPATNSVAAAIQKPHSNNVLPTPAAVPATAAPVAAAPPASSPAGLPDYLISTSGGASADITLSVCSYDGFFQYPGDCSRFIRCQATQPPAIFTCSPPLFFDEGITSCNWPAAVICRYDSATQAKQFESIIKALNFDEP